MDNEKLPERTISDEELMELLKELEKGFPRTPAYHSGSREREDKTSYDATTFDFQIVHKENSGKKINSFYNGQKVPGFYDAVYIEQLPDEGGLSSIHKIYNRKENVHYAMKIPENELLRDPKICRLFLEEAKVLAGLPSHPNLIKPVHFLKWNDMPCLFTEFIEGKTLDKISQLRASKIQGSFKITDLISIFIEICRGLNFAYQQKGLIHLDLKPKNILWNESDGHLKIIDFGLSRFISESYKNIYSFGFNKRLFNDDEADRTNFEDNKPGNNVAGTFPYMSPEHFKGLEYCDTRSDIYSMGIIMYELSTGHKPFMASDKETYKKLHLEKDIITVPGVDKEIKDIILKCLKKNPIDRYNTFKELLHSLEITYFSFKGINYPQHEDSKESIMNEYNNKACMFIGFSDYEKALDMANKALEEDPEDLSAQMRKAYSVYYLGFYNDSLEIAEKVLEREPDNKEALYLKGHGYYTLNEQEKAVECYETIKKIYQEETLIVNSYLARCYIQANRLVEAELYIEEGLKEDPDDRDLILGKANFFIADGQTEKVINLLKPFLEADWNGDFHDLYAVALRRNNEYGKSIEVLKDYLSYDRDNHIIWARLGETYSMYWSFEDANKFSCEAYEEAVKLQPNNTNYVTWVINKSIDMGAKDKILYYADKWQDKTMSFELVQQFVRGLIYAENMKMALSFNLKALELMPESLDAASTQIMLLLKNNRAKEALSFGFEWQQSFKPDEFFLKYMGNALRESGQNEEALYYYWKALESKHLNVNNLYGIGDYYEGFFPEVRRNFINIFNETYENSINSLFADRIMSRFGNNANCLSHLGDEFYEIKQSEEALVCYKKSLDDEKFGLSHVFERVIDLLSEMGKTEDIISIIDMRIEKNSINAYSINKAGIVLYKNGRYNKAEEYFKTAYEKDPDDVDAVAFIDNCLDLLLFQKKYEELLDYWTFWAKNKEISGKSLYIVGEAHRHCSLYEEAEKFFRLAYSKGIQSLEWLNSVCIVLQEQGKTAEKIEIGLEWIENNEPHEGFISHIANLLYHEGRFNEAEYLYKKALDINPASIKYAKDYISTLYKNTKNKEIIEFGVEWLKKYEPDAIFNNIVGIAYSNLYDYKESYKYFFEASRLNPEDSNIAGNVVFALNNLKKHKDALEFGLNWTEKHNTNNYLDKQIEIARIEYGIYHV